MKHFLLLCLLALATPGRAQTALRMPLRDVTLYRQGTELHHRAELALPAGPAEVRLTGLSPLLDKSSVLADVSGAELLDVQFVDVAPGGSPPASPLADTLRRAEAALRRLQTEELTVAAEIEFLTKNQQLERISPGQWTTETRQAAAYYSQRMGVLGERAAALKTLIPIQTNRTASDRAALGNQTALANAQTVLLRLNLRRATTVRVDILYQVSSYSSGWVPQYELRVNDDDLAHLRVLSRARLDNYSGLPWTNVPVNLRTTELNADIDRPSLATPWLLRRGAESPGEGRLDGFAVKGQSSATAPTGTSDAPDLGARLALAEPVTLANNQSRSYPLTEQRVPLLLEYLAVPKLDEQVFLIGRVPDWNQLNFLAESATVFFRGAYVGETDIDNRAFADTMEVSLGRDPQVQLTRTKREDFESLTNSGNRRKTRLAYEINVKNTHPYPVSLRLLDQVPVSQDKDVTVKLQDISGATHDEAAGKLTWRFVLPAGASRRFHTAFTVDLPADSRIRIRESREIKNPKFR